MFSPGEVQPQLSLINRSCSRVKSSASIFALCTVEAVERKSRFGRRFTNGSGSKLLSLNYKSMSK